MARIIPPEEIGSPTLDGRKVAILGYGNQGRAQALNLRDEGVDLVIGQREGKSAEHAREDAMVVLPVADAVLRSDVLMLTLPDETAGAIYAAEIAPHLQAGSSLLFTHGFNIHFGFIVPPEGSTVALVAPKGQALAVRNGYVQGTGVPGLIAIHKDPNGQAWEVAFGYAHAAGYTHSVLFETTFAEETETDLFGEQVVLCGGMIELMKAAYHTLVDAGYSPEMAYFECVHETKLIVDLLVAQGLEAMRRGISDTAEWGGYLAGDRIVTDATRAEMRAILGEIRSGAFAKGWVGEALKGKETLTAKRRAEADDDICRTGDSIRSALNR